MARGFARLRERNQLTLPQALVEKMGLSLGDLVEFSITDQGAIELRAAKIVTHGSPEALKEVEAAKKDILQGRYTVIGNMNEFQQHVDRLRPIDVGVEENAAGVREKIEGENARGSIKWIPGLNADGVSVGPECIPEGGHLSPQQRQDVEGIVEAVVKRLKLEDTGSRSILREHADRLEQR